LKEIFIQTIPQRIGIKYRGGVIIGDDTRFGKAAYSNYDKKEDKLAEGKDTEKTELECALKEKDILEIMRLRVKALEMLLDNSGIIAFIRKENGSVEFVSEQIEEFGYKAQDFISGKVNFKDIIHPDDLDRVFLELKENALEGAAGLSQKYRIRTKKEYVKTVEDKTTFIHDENGSVAYIIGILTEID
jgi:PAS domain S-box-containing protein